MMKYEWINFEGYKLRAPVGFLESKQAEIGRCGPGKLGGRLVPDKILGLSIRPACKIHDYTYQVGETQEDKDNSDIELFANGFRIIKQRSNWIMVGLRSLILHIYFMACIYGGNLVYGDEDE